MPFVSCNELAIATKSIASVSPPRTTIAFVENCPLFEWWEKSPEGKEGANIFLKYATYTLIEYEKALRDFITECL